MLLQRCDRTGVRVGGSNENRGRRAVLRRLRLVVMVEAWRVRLFRSLRAGARCHPEKRVEGQCESRPVQCCLVGGRENVTHGVGAEELSLWFTYAWSRAIREVRLLWGPPLKVEHLHCWHIGGVRHPSRLSSAEREFGRGRWRRACDLQKDLTWTDGPRQNILSGLRGRSRRAWGWWSKSRVIGELIRGVRVRVGSSGARRWNFCMRKRWNSQPPRCG